MHKIITILDTEEDKEEGQQSEDPDVDEGEYCDTIMEIQNQIIDNEIKNTRNFARTVIDTINTNN